MHSENGFYNGDVMAGRPPLKEAPAFGQRLAALRKSLGLSQRELAERLGTTREMIDYYERRAVNPTLEFIQQAAEALKVSVAELLGSELKATRAKPGPTPQLQLRFEQIRRLPRKEQQFILQLLDTALERARRA